MTSTAFWANVRRLEADPRFAVLRKRKPGWVRAAQRHEHGIDYALYCRWAASGFRAVVVVEQRPPDGGPAACLWMTLDTCARRGRRLRSWPNASGGEGGLGGWLWPRAAMRRVNPAELPGLLETSLRPAPRRQPAPPRLPLQRSLF